MPGPELKAFTASTRCCASPGSGVVILKPGARHQVCWRAASSARLLLPRHLQQRQTRLHKSHCAGVPEPLTTYQPALQVLSDIHLEFRKGKQFTFPVTAPILCLLGDNGNPGSLVYQEFLHAQAERYEHVLVLKGNHSCYGRTMEEADHLIAEVCAAHPAKLHYLNKSSYEVNDTFVILGCTLWSHVTNKQRLMVYSMLADHRCITQWSVARNNEVHAAELAWLKAALAQIEEAGKKAIVLTHHAPSCRGTSAPEHNDSPISSAFGTDLDYLLKPPIVLWMFGHTHHSSDQCINGVRVCSNQLDYPNEKVDFDPGFAVQLEGLV